MHVCHAEYTQRAANIVTSENAQSIVHLYKN